MTPVKRMGGNGRITGQMGLALTLLAASPAPAQTMAEAAWANMAVAVQLCEIRTSDLDAWAQSFRNTGFSEPSDRSDVAEYITHRFTAPAQTVVVDISYGETPEECHLHSAYLDVTLASHLLDELIPKLHPTYVRKVTNGEVGPSGQPALCVSYEDPSTPIGHVVGASSEQGCVDDGTSRIYSSYRF
ncbi:hypothetical protein [Pseudotabrizicola formosa]|uniref:hypothetical protein n=1 Tax=Pseudotabrizicola formosa TaxID=2030009 RepID=UPI0011AEFD39|nr:hypothetical protein [Pseudotabrizicola formosa]